MLLRWVFRRSIGAFRICRAKSASFANPALNAAPPLALRCSSGHPSGPSEKCLAASLRRSNYLSWAECGGRRVTLAQLATQAIGSQSQRGMLPSHTAQQATLDGQLPNPNPGVGEGGHSKGHTGQVAKGWQGTRIRTRQAH